MSSSLNVESTAPAPPQQACHRSATNCAGTCMAISFRIGPSRPTRFAIIAAKRLCRYGVSRPSNPAREWAVRPITGTGRPGAGANLTPFCAPTLRTGMERRPFQLKWRSRIGRHLCRNGVLSRSVRKAVRHCRQGRKSAWQGAGGRKSVRGTTAERVSAKASAYHRSGRDLQRGNLEARLQTFSLAGGEFAGGLHQPRWYAAWSVPVLRPLRALHLRSQCQGEPRSSALSDAEKAQELRIASANAC